MLTEVVLQTSDPMTLKIEDADPTESLILEGISGLTPQDVTTFTGDFARSGGYYQGRRVGSRFPVFKFKLNPNYAEDVEVSDIRERLYRQFYEPLADSDRVTVILRDDRKPERFFNCYAEKWDGEIFEKSPKAQISTVCVDAYILSLAYTSGNNEAGWVTVPISYDGSADTGIELTIKVVADTSVINIENSGQLMTLAGDFQADDILHICTVDGSRFIRLNGVDKMVLLQSPPAWIQLKSASNLLRTYGTSIGDGVSVITSYQFRSAWRGV